MKIDLHCHTKAVRSGELTTRNVDVELFKTKILGAGVRIVAITNHDIFDKLQFVQFQTAVLGHCILWPGVELNVTHSSGTFHLIVIMSPNKIEEFEEALLGLTVGKTGDFNLPIEEVISTFDAHDAIFLPHYGNKKPAITQNGLDAITVLLKNSSRIILEDSNTRSTAILASHGMNTVTGSDVQNWNDYHNSDLSELRLPIDGFEQFCNFLDRDPIVIKSILDKNTPRKYDAQPSEEDKDITVPVHLFAEVNILFGDKGTGKSQMIKSIQNKMIANSMSVSAYISSEKEVKMEQLLDENDMHRLSSKFSTADCKSDFLTIKNWGDLEPTNLQSYIDHATSKHASSSKDRIKWVDMQATKYDELKLKQVDNDLNVIVESADDLSKLGKNYLKQEESVLLDQQLQKLEDTVEISYRSELIDKYSFRLLYNSLRKIRTLVSMKTGTVPKPINTGFHDYAINRVALLTASEAILKNLEPNEHIEHEHLGDIGNKGSVHISSRWRMYNDSDSRYDEYKTGVRITELKDAKANLKRIKKNVFESKLDDLIADFNMFYINGIDCTDVFVGIKKYTTDDKFEPYKLSNGERSIVLIQKSLKADADAYLLDEPELSMSNSYIDEVIRPKVTELGAQKKTVLIATHNANLAVRTLPYSTIYRFHDKDGYKTYVGNPFVNSLVNIEDSGDVLDWKDTGMLVLEGGEDAFNDRGEIYASGRK